jgi:hypothetical protein
MIYADNTQRGDVMDKRERSEVIMIRVSAEDKRAFEATAEKLDMKVSEFVRAATLLYLAVTVNPHGLKMLVKGAANSIREAMERFREPGLRKVVFGVKRDLSR